MKRKREVAEGQVRWADLLTEVNGGTWIKVRADAVTAIHELTMGRTRIYGHGLPAEGILIGQAAHDVILAICGEDET